MTPAAGGTGRRARIGNSGAAVPRHVAGGRPPAENDRQIFMRRIRYITGVVIDTRREGGYNVIERPC